MSISGFPFAERVAGVFMASGAQTGELVNDRGHARCGEAPQG